MRHISPQASWVRHTGERDDCTLCDLYVSRRADMNPVHRWLHRMWWEYPGAIGGVVGGSIAGVVLTVLAKSGALS